MLFLLIKSKCSYLKTGPVQVCPGKHSTCLTNQAAQAGTLHSAKPGESKRIFLSPPSLVPETGQLAKGSVKNLCEDAVFKCSSFLILLPQYSVFPDLFRNMLICRKPATGAPNGSPPVRGVWGSSCISKSSLT